MIKGVPFIDILEPSTCTSEIYRDINGYPCRRCNKNENINTYIFNELFCDQNLWSHDFPGNQNDYDDTA